MSGVMQRVLEGGMLYFSLSIDSWNRDFSQTGYWRFLVLWRWERSCAVLDQRIGPWADPYEEIPF